MRGTDERERGARATVAMLVACLSWACAPSAAPVDEAAVDAIFEELTEGVTPGAAVAVVRDGAVVLRRGYGYADLEHGVPVTPSTVFDIASVSKQFAAMSIAMLVESGELALEDDVRARIPEMQDFGEVITIDHLVHHTSGLRDWPGTLAVAGWRMDDVIAYDQILTMARHQRSLNFAPGAEYSYSNTGYNLLAETVTRVTGQSFRAWTDEHLFRPLGMDDTHFHDDHTEVVDGRALGYQAVDGGFRNVANGLTALGSSSLYSTVDDLASWILNFEDAGVGGPAVVERMRAQGVLNDGEVIPYAFGQSRGAYRGLETWSHTGSWAGFRTVLVRIPERSFGVVILSNLGSFDPSNAAFALIDLYLEDDLAPEEDDAPSTSRETVGVPREVLDEYAGTYRLGPGWLLDIRRVGDALEAQATGEPAFSTQAISPTEFWVEAYGASVDFRRGPGGEVAHLVYRDITAPRVTVVTPEDVDGDELVGTYESTELDTTYRIEILDGGLAAVHRRHGAVGLTPLVVDEFVGDQWFVPSLVFERSPAGEVVGFRIDQGRSRAIRFARVRRPIP